MFTKTRNQCLPNAIGIMNKPTNISLTAKLTMRIFDAVRNFLTRQTAKITTRLPTTVTKIINEQIIIITMAFTVLRGGGSEEFVSDSVVN